MNNSPYNTNNRKQYIKCCICNHVNDLTSPAPVDSGDSLQCGGCCGITRITVRGCVTFTERRNPLFPEPAGESSAWEGFVNKAFPTTS